jgi:Polyketide cyclase / dehydrase and lipid transport
MPNPVTVSIDVPQPRDEVFAFLDVMANHEPFTNHMLVDWSYSGPDRGVGSKARVHSKAAGRTEVVDIEVVGAETPARIVERNVSAKGKRVGHGTYELAELPDGGTRIAFTYAWEQAPVADRALAPLVRSILRRGNQRAMERLAQQLPRVPALR